MPPPPHIASDEALFEALGREDATALDELFRRHYAELCRTAMRFVGESAAAEDIVQEFFLFLWKRRNQLPSGISSVGAYLRRAVRNRSLNYLRDRNRIPIDDGELPDIPSSAPRDTEAETNEELAQRLQSAIDRLPERCRLIFVMSRVEGMSHREIAEELDISTKTIENQMTRAYRFLRQWLSGQPTDQTGG